MTASITVINSDDDLIDTNTTISGNSVANLTHQFVGTTNTVTNIARRSLKMYNNATAAMDVVYNTNNNNNNNNNNKNNFSLSPSSFLYVASTSAVQENNSFAYEESLLVEQEVINRTLLLNGAGSAAGVSVSATAATASRALNAEEWSHFYDLMLSWQGICLIVVFCTFIVITTIGNTLVILAVITTRRLRTVTNCFVMSLAVADLLVGIFVMPPAVAVHLIGSWQLGWVLCDIWISLDVLLCTASILSLCAISVDRYFSVTRPLTYSRKYRTKKLALFVILGVWIGSLAITCPPILGWYEPGRRSLKECRYNQNEGYVIFSAMGSFFIPMAVMIYVYARISCVVASRHDNMTDISVHNKKFKRYTSADVDNDIDHDLSEQEVSSGHKKQVAARTFSNQTIAKELHEVLMSENGENGNGTAGSSGPSAGHCHSLLTLSTTPTTSAKNGCYELTRPSSLKRTPTASSTMTTMTSACGGGGGGASGVTSSAGGSLEPHWSRPQSMRHNKHHHHHNLNAPPASGSGLLVASPQLQDAPTPAGTMRNTSRSVHHHHHHHHHHPTKSLSNRITSLKKENKTNQTLSIVMGGFIACWLPFFINYLITPFLADDQVSKTLAYVLTWLGWLNSGINPFIYAFYSVDFRAAFWRLTCKRCFSASSKPQFPTNTMSMRR